MHNLATTEARKRFFDLIKNVNVHHQTYHIQHPKGTVVMLAEEDYEALLETLTLLSIPGFRDSMKEPVKQMKQKKNLFHERCIWSIKLCVPIRAASLKFRH